MCVCLHFQVSETIRSLIKSNIRSACTNDTLLHLCVSRLNIIKSGYFNDGTGMRVILITQLNSMSNDFICLFVFSQGIFPNLKVVRLLLNCDADVNAKNESKSTALHVASNPYNYVGEVCIRNMNRVTNKKVEMKNYWFFFLFLYLCLSFTKTGCSSIVRLWSPFGSTKSSRRASALFDCF